MQKVELLDGTIPYEVIGNFGAGHVLLKPASGRYHGITPAVPYVPLWEAAGVHDILTKAIGTNNPHNVLRATFAGLRSLRSAEQVGRMRGKTLSIKRK